MNKGVIQATGEYNGFINGGDFIYKDTLININKIFSEQKQIHFLV